MSPSQAGSRERLQFQQAIDAEIKSLEESVRVLKLRRNALSPVSSLPPEIFAAIFAFLCLPALEGVHHQARLRVSHVCHQWREIAINQPLLWSNANLTSLSLAGATEILARAKSVPLYLEASIPGRRHWDDVRFSTFRQELQARLPDVCHLTIGAELTRLHKTLEELISPAPTLEYLSLFSCGGYLNSETGDHLFIPDALFSGSAPRLSRLKLFNCEISWNSPLLKGLEHLEVLSPNPRPKLAAWLDALEEMTRLQTLILHSASPIAPQGDVKHNTTLPSLTHLEILDSPADCALSLAHLDLPALTELAITVAFRYPGNHDIKVLLPHLAQHAHGPQDTQPLQSVLVCGEGNGAKILAWTLPDIDIAVQDLPTFHAPTTLPPRVALFFTSVFWSHHDTHLKILDKTMVALPLSGVVTLLTQDFTAPPEALSHYQTLPFTLRKCIEQGMPLARLALSMCVTPSPEEVPLLSEIMVDVLGPDNTAETREWMISRWKSVVRAPFSEEIYFKSEYNSYPYDSWEDR